MSGHSNYLFLSLIRFVFGPNLDESSNNDLCSEENHSNDICMKASGICETESSSMSLSSSKIIPNIFTKFLYWANSILTNGNILLLQDFKWSLVNSVTCQHKSVITQVSCQERTDVHHQLLIWVNFQNRLDVNRQMLTIR